MQLQKGAETIDAGQAKAAGHAPDGYDGRIGVFGGIAATRLKGVHRGRRAVVVGAELADGKIHRGPPLGGPGSRNEACRVADGDVINYRFNV